MSLKSSSLLQKFFYLDFMSFKGLSDFLDGLHSLVERNDLLIYKIGHHYL